MLLAPWFGALSMFDAFWLNEIRGYDKGISLTLESRLYKDCILIVACNRRKKGIVMYLERGATL